MLTTGMRLLWDGWLSFEDPTPNHGRTHTASFVGHLREGGAHPEKQAVARFALMGLSFLVCPTHVRFCSCHEPKLIFFSLGHPWMIGQAACSEDVSARGVSYVALQRNRQPKSQSFCIIS